MGGGAFAHAIAQDVPTLNTPRMSPEEYARMKAHCLSYLSGYFPGCKVAALIEAPEKTDYGDIDFIIATDPQVDFTLLADFIGAEGLIFRSAQKCCFGMPKDGSRPSSTVVYKPISANALAKIDPPIPMSVKEHAQVDIEIVPPELFDWYSFYASYGDMASMLGKIVTFLGFTVSDKGFFLRMSELDETKSNPLVQVADTDGMIRLSSDPAQVIQFLGLSKEKYDGGFLTLEEFFQWLSECKLLSSDIVKLKRNRATDRHREIKRTIYATFFHEWLPKHKGKEDQETMKEGPNEMLSTQLAAKRQYWLEEAVEFFDKRAKFEIMHDALILQVKNAIANQLLKSIVGHQSGKQDKSLNEIMRAFRRWVSYEDGQLSMLDVPHDDSASELHHLLSDDQSSLVDQEAITQWVKQHWEILRSLERQRMKKQLD